MLLTRWTDNLLAAHELCGLRWVIRNFSWVGLGTEQGFDKLARHVYGFFGHALEMEVNSQTKPYPFGHVSSGWTLHPLSQIIFGKTLTYQIHNLADEAFATSLNNTCWALASGARLSMSAASAPQWGSKAPWYRSVAVMQRVVASRWTGFAQVSFDRDPTSAVSETVLESTWSADSPPIFNESSTRCAIFLSFSYHLAVLLSSASLKTPRSLYCCNHARLTLVSICPLQFDASK